MRDPIRINPVSALAERARAFFRTDVTRDIDFRKAKLKSFAAAVRAHENEILDALAKDFGRPRYEAYPSEVGALVAEALEAARLVTEWARPKRVPGPLVIFPSKSFITPDPLGTALILAPWNYPLNLALSPLVGAIAAGCNAVLKPSELSPASAAVFEKVCRAAFGDDGFVTVVQGDVSTAQALLEEKWDIICFTGSPRVGKSVMEAAAKHLTPVILELGGKSPVIIDESVNLKTACERVAWGKFFNAGQTCVAPDYALVHRKSKDAFVAGLKAALGRFYGQNPQMSPDYTRIISDRHMQRLVSLTSGGRVVIGGECDLKTRYFAPTVLTDVDLGSPLMTEEIFGPLLPIVEVDSVDAAIAFVRDRPKPLALYVFTKNSKAGEKVLNLTSSGGAVINDVISHWANSNLPFGGVGNSGMGAYHGEHSFHAFTHHRAVLKRPSWSADGVIRLPPYPSSLFAWKKLIG